MHTAIWQTTMPGTASVFSNLHTCEASTWGLSRPEASWGPLVGPYKVPYQRTAFTDFPCKVGGLEPVATSAPHRCAEGA